MCRNVVRRAPAKPKEDDSDMLTWLFDDGCDDNLATDAVDAEAQAGELASPDDVPLLAAVRQRRIRKRGRWRPTSVVGGSGDEGGGSAIWASGGSFSTDDDFM